MQLWIGGLCGIAALAMLARACHLAWWCHKEEDRLVAMLLAVPILIHALMAALLLLGRSA